MYRPVVSPFPVWGVGYVGVACVLVYRGAIRQCRAHVEEIHPHTRNHERRRHARQREVESWKLRICLRQPLALLYSLCARRICALIPHKFRVVRTPSINPLRVAVYHVVEHLIADALYYIVPCVAACETRLEHNTACGTRVAYLAKLLLVWLKTQQNRRAQNLAVPAVNLAAGRISHYLAHRLNGTVSIYVSALLVVAVRRPS